MICPTTHLSIEDCLTERGCPVHKRIANNILAGKQQLEGLSDEELTMLDDLED